MVAITNQWKEDCKRRRESWF